VTKSLLDAVAAIVDGDADVVPIIVFAPNEERDGGSTESKPEEFDIRITSRERKTKGDGVNPL